MNLKQSTLGILVILAGVVVLLSNINLGPVRELAADWWPVFIVLLGLLMWWSNPRNFVWALAVTLAGGLLLVNSLDLADINFGQIFWPLIIIGFGVNLVLAGRRRDSQPTEESEERLSAILGGTEGRNASRDYRGATINALMGGVELDISRARIKKEATINVSAIMGGVSIRVPEDVTVKNRATALLGGFEDKTRPTKDNGPVLYLDGSVIMGGVEIKR